MIWPMIEFKEDEEPMLATLRPLNNELNRVTQADTVIWFTSRWPDVVSVHDQRDEPERAEVHNYERVNIQRLIEELAKEPAGAGVGGILRAAARVNPPPVKRGRRKTKEVAA